jgi:hypothetical protein
MLVTERDIFIHGAEEVAEYLVQNPEELDRLVDAKSKSFKLWLHMNLDLAGWLVNGNRTEQPCDLNAELVFQQDSRAVFHHILHEPKLLNSWRFGFFARGVSNSRMAMQAVQTLLRVRRGSQLVPDTSNRCSWCLRRWDIGDFDGCYCCGDCREALYCHRKCQLLHWTFHSKTCGTRADCNLEEVSYVKGKERTCNKSDHSMEATDFTDSEFTNSDELFDMNSTDYGHTNS